MVLGDIPMITRTYMLLALLTTTLCALDVVTPFQLYLSFELIVQEGQYWRLLTNFFFFGGNFNLNFLFHMFFLVRYSSALEEGSFRGRTADFFWMLVVGGSLMVCLTPFVQLNFLGESLAFMMVYVWGRRNTNVHMSLLGSITFSAPYLPYVLLAFSYFLGSSGLVDIVGIIVGHLYYFLEDVYPRMLTSRRRILKTPWLVEQLFAAGGGGAVEEEAAFDEDAFNAEFAAAGGDMGGNNGNDNIDHGAQDHPHED
jgi:Derlin-2/3